MIVLDTNAVLRFLLRDDEQKAVYVRDTMDRETCLVPVEVLAEVVYVLVKFYGIERTLIRQKLSGFLRNENVEMPNLDVVETALRYFGETKLDFVDCLMIGYAIAEGHRIFTFDKQLQKYLP
jgi:predicted nucleic-acid-binding protein